MTQFRFKRRRQHLREQGQWTSQAQDWQEIYVTRTADRLSARQLEKQIKARALGDIWRITAFARRNDCPPE